MRAALHVVRTAGLNFCICAALAACASGSGGSSAGASPGPSAVVSGPAWNGAPTGPAERMASSKAVTGSFDLAKWVVNKSSGTNSKASFELTSGRGRSKAVFFLTGSGAAVAEEIYSPAVAVTPGSTYTFSAIVDASKVTSGSSYLWISNVTRDQLYGSGQVAPGQKGRFGFHARIPDGVQKVRVGFYTGGSTVKQGARLTFADPSLTKSRP